MLLEMTLVLNGSDNDQYLSINILIIGISLLRKWKQTPREKYS